MVVIGFAAGRIPTLKVNYVLLKNIELSGLQISDYRKRTPELIDTCFEEVFDLHRVGAIAAPAHRELPLADWAAALVLMEGRRARERLVLRP
jgi:NADPH2:quinone reductase